MIKQTKRRTSLKVKAAELSDLFEDDAHAVSILQHARRDVLGRHDFLSAIRFSTHFRLKSALKRNNDKSKRISHRCFEFRSVEVHRLIRILDVIQTETASMSRCRWSTTTLATQLERERVAVGNVDDHHRAGVAIRFTRRVVGLGALVASYDESSTTPSAPSPVPPTVPDHRRTFSVKV